MELNVCLLIVNGEEEEDTDATPVPVHVMIDGPYGGCSVDPSSYETVLLVSGGSGATFTIAVLDALVGKYIRSGPDQVVTRKIEFVWFIRSYGAGIPHLFFRLTNEGEPRANKLVRKSVKDHCVTRLVCVSESGSPYHNIRHVFMHARKPTRNSKL